LKTSAPILAIDEQQTAINAIDGVWVVLAGPGSGKTFCLTKRYCKMLESDIPSGDILNLTFTANAAAEMATRAGILDAKSVFRTFHSFALDLLKKERDKLPFETCDTIIPVELQDYQLMFDLVKLYPAINWRMLQERITGWKCADVAPDQAIEEEQHNGVGYFYALAYREYEIRCRQQGWLDFSSLMQEAVKLLETNEEVRNRYKRKYISVDEAQDCDEVQFRLLQLIFDGNIFAVGDENQCQPPETMVDVLIQPSRGRNAATVKQIRIDKIRPNKDKIVSWDSRGKRMRLGKGRKFKIAKRKYCGRLLRIYSNGVSTRVTPDHFFWTKFNRKALENAKTTHFVYLMWKEGLGFRVGTSRFRTTSGSNQISHRGYKKQIRCGF